MTKQEIDFNYAKAIQQATQIEEISSRMTGSLRGEMTQILDQVRLAWASESTPQYLRKGEKVAGDIGTVGKNLAEIAETIRTIAERLRKTEEEVWRITNERR